MLLAFRGTVVGLFTGPAGVRWRTTFKTRTFPWHEIAGFELRPSKWRAVAVSGLVFTTTSGETVETDLIVAPYGRRQPSSGLYTEAEITELVAELEAQRAEAASRSPG